MNDVQNLRCSLNLIYDNRRFTRPRPNAVLKALWEEEWERKYIDELVSPKIQDGQSVHHLCVTNAAKLIRNERTACNDVAFI